MANIVYMAKSAWTGLLDTIRSKASVSGTMTVSQAADAVESISGGGVEDEIISRTISGIYENNRVTQIGSYAFTSCISLTAVSFQNVETIGSSAFFTCSNLTTANFPNALYLHNGVFSMCSNLGTISFPRAERLGTGAFRGCSALSEVTLPSATYIDGGAFSNCINLSKITLPCVSYIATGTFQKCYQLMEVRLDNISSVPNCPNITTTFSSTPIYNYTASTGGYGSVFVPASLYESFLTDTSWKTLSYRIVSV